MPSDAVKPKDLVLDVTTTSVGRMLLRETYESFFRHVRFSGRYNFVITIDPTYGVSCEEIAETVRYARALNDIDARVCGVTVEHFPRNVGLQRALLVALSHCFHAFGINLEDDWSFFGDVDLDALILDLVDQDSTLIGFNSVSVSDRGTFARASEAVPIHGSRVPLMRLIPPSWASDYLPLHPHVHQSQRWIPTYVRALMLDDDPDRCPDERVKEYMRASGTQERQNVLWTREVVVQDTGREWLIGRGQTKNIGADRETEQIVPVVKLAEGLPVIERSLELQRRARAIIPGETQTFMKRAVNFAPGAYPVFVDRGSGAYVWDVDGNLYLDFIASLGAASLGHASRTVETSIRGNLRRGVLLSLPTLLEIEAAESVAMTVPGAERVRFLKTGADACSAAIRLARFLTGRDHVASCGYHGWHDIWTAGSPGVAKSPVVHVFDVAIETGPSSLEEIVAAHRDDLACVIVAVPYELVLSADRVKAIETLCRNAHAVLIFDEVVTGFRLALGGAQEYFGVRADLVCLSKSLGAGMPIAAVCGPASVMDAMQHLHVSTTFGGELLSLAAVIAVLREYRTTDYVTRIWKLGAEFMEELNRVAAGIGLPPIVHGYPPLPCFRFAEDPVQHQTAARCFLGAAAARGVLFRRDVNFITGAHSSADIEYATIASSDALKTAKKQGWGSREN